MLDVTTITPMQATDVDALVALEQAHYGQDAYSPTWFHQCLLQWPQWQFCARQQQQPCGYLSVAPGAEAGQLWLMALLVAASARGQGLGKRLLATLLEHGRHYDIHLTVAPDNRSAIALYESYGFRLKQQLPNALGIGNHRLHMQRLKDIVEP